MKMKVAYRFLTYAAVVTLLAIPSFRPAWGADALVIGDGSDNSLKRFDAATGTFQGTLVKSQGGLHGLRGLVVDGDGNLLVSDQNGGTATRGDISLYSGTTGELLRRVVSHNDPNAPDVPRGMILWGNTIFVADLTTETQKNQPITPGRLLAYGTDGTLLRDLTPDPNAFPTGQFHPRAMVIGPDGLLYVSNIPDLVPPPQVSLGGQVLRFNPNTGAFVDVFLDDSGGVGRLNRPEGLVFGPDGLLYITSFRADPTDIDAIRIYGAGGFLRKINLYNPTTQSRVYAQALLFGPGGRLFVPLNNTGEVRRYNVATDLYDVFIAGGGPLGQPWYLTFGRTDPATLSYVE
jgi:hypothetical protein